MIRKLLLSALAALTLGLAGLGLGARTVSAEVVTEYWQPVTVAGPPQTPPLVPARDTRCPGETSPIYLTGMAHYVWYIAADGVLKMNVHAHLTGTDADGVEYVANIQRHMEHPAWPPSLMPFSDTYTTNLISKGSTVNAQIVWTFDMYPVNPITTVVACRG